MSFHITAPVGKSAKNNAADVNTVRKLLNENIRFLIPYKPPAETGPMDDLVLALIAEFQRRVLNLPMPSGKIDPNDATFHKLVAGVIKPRPAHVEAFIQKILPAAIKCRTTWKVPVSIVIAQAAQESGWGQHVVDNAYFGIKGKAPDGSSTTFRTTEVIGGKTIKINDTFRAYKDIDEATDDYGRMLSTNPLYAKCFAHINDPFKFAECLQSSGYATDPKYAAQLKSIITHQRLTEYDR